MRLALEPLAHHVGDEVAEVRLLRRELARVRLEGHGRAADDDVEILGEPLRIARHQRRDDGVGLHALAHLAERPRALDEPPVPRDPEVHLHQIARVRARLRDERLALLGDQRLVLVAAQDHVEAGGPGKRSVGGHPLMGDRDDELRPARPEPRRRLPARDARIAEDDVGARARDPRGLGRREPEEADREAVEGQEEVGPRAAEDAPRGSVHHVGRQPHELRLGHALAQHVGAEVELVVAEGREVEPDRVERRDHLRAAQHPGLDGRRQRVAREDEDGVRVLPPRLAHERRQARDSPALPPSTGSRTYRSLIWSSVILTRSASRALRDAHAARSAAARTRTRSAGRSRGRADTAQVSRAPATARVFQ